VRSLKELTWFDLDDMELAKQLTLTVYQTYSSIKVLIYSPSSRLIGRMSIKRKLIMCVADHRIPASGLEQAQAAAPGTEPFEDDTRIQHLLCGIMTRLIRVICIDFFFFFLLYSCCSYSPSSQQVATAIVTEPKVRNRAKIMEKFINLAQVRHSVPTLTLRFLFKRSHSLSLFFLSRSCTCCRHYAR
jgi:hypothetical protein